MRALLWILPVIGLGACASQPEAPCRTIDCEMQHVVAEVAQTCRMDLIRYPRPRRDYIDREYQYPLGNHRSYVNLINMGGDGPSTCRWCQAFAEQRVQFRLVSEHR